MFYLYASFYFALGGLFTDYVAFGKRSANLYKEHAVNWNNNNDYEEASKFYACFFKWLQVTNIQDA